MRCNFLCYRDCTNLGAMTKYIAPILVLTASAIYLRWCIKDAQRPPTDVTRQEFYHSNTTGEDWELETDPYSE